MLHSTLDVDIFFRMTLSNEKQTTDLKLGMSAVSTVASEVSKYKFDTISMQEAISDKGSTEPANDYIFFYGNNNDYHPLRMGLFVCE
jgi:hypothetical protein